MDAFVRLPGSSPLPDEVVEAELARIEASDGFRQSPQLRRLLRHLIGAVQKGRPEELRELVLGVLVFRRDPATFDPKQDPIVRVEARRLRSRLEAFYAAHGTVEGLQIELPKGGYAPVLHRVPPRTARALPALAVLPFANLTGDPQREAFCDGVTDELIDALVHLRNARIVARTSTFQFKGRHDDVRLIGRKLDVDLVLEGSVQVQGARYRVIAQMIDARDGCHVWSQAFESEASDIFAVQNAMARDIVRSLELAGAMQGRDAVLDPAESIVPPSTRDAEARELFDRARFIVRRLDLERYPHARKLLQQAVARDPAFARAHLLLGLVESNLVSHAAARSTSALTQAIGHIQRAVELDPLLGSAHAMLGWIAMNHELDWQRAEVHYRRALRASPGDVSVRNGWANFLAYTGRFPDADREYAFARQLDPLHVVPRVNRALMLFYARAYDAALAEYRQVEEMDPRQIGMNVLAMVHVMRRDPGQALAAAEETVTRFPGSPIGYCRKAEALALAGQADEARQTLTSIQAALRNAGVEHWARAHVDAVLGDFNAVLVDLAAAGTEREANFCTAAVVPYFAPLHADPRWTALVRAQHLPEIDEDAWDVEFSLPTPAS